MLEPADKAPSKCAVREDVWVRIPPAAPNPPIEIECRARPVDVTACADLREREATYVYVLGAYLGDGYLTLAPKNVWRLRLFQDARYPGLIDRWACAVMDLSGTRAGRQRRHGCFEIYSNWKHWLCLFPQHGPGPKHTRRIALEPWQGRLVQQHPKSLIRGLVESDGCRTMNRVSRPAIGGRRQYAYVRYFFSNRSLDIQRLFGDACDELGIDWRRNRFNSLSVARRESVARLEALVGPKY